MPTVSACWIWVALNCSPASSSTSSRSCRRSGAPAGGGAALLPAAVAATSAAAGAAASCKRGATMLPLGACALWIVECRMLGMCCCWGGAPAAATAVRRCSKRSRVLPAATVATVHSVGNRPDIRHQHGRVRCEDCSKTQQPCCRPQHAAQTGRRAGCRNGTCNCTASTVTCKTSRVRCM